MKKSFAIRFGFDIRFTLACIDIDKHFLIDVDMGRRSIFPALFPMVIAFYLPGNAIIRTDGIWLI